MTNIGIIDLIMDIFFSISTLCKYPNSRISFGVHLSFLTWVIARIRHGVLWGILDHSWLTINSCSNLMNSTILFALLNLLNSLFFLYSSMHALHPSSLFCLFAQLHNRKNIFYRSTVMLLCRFNKMASIHLATE